MKPCAAPPEPQRAPARSWIPFLPEQASRVWGLILVGVVLSVRLGAGPWVANPARELPSPFLLWDSSFTLRTEGGYRDNVLQSATNQHPTAFAGLGADWFLFRLPMDGPGVNFLFSADDRRYLDPFPATTNAPGAALEQSFVTHASLKHALSRGWSVSLTGLHYYADQVFDASDLDNGFGSVRAQGHQLNLTPALRRDFGRGGWTEASVVMARQFFADPISSYWEGGPKLEAGWMYATNSSVAVTLSTVRRAYDDRFQFSRFGDPYPALSLSTDDYKAQLAWKQAWDRRGWWQSTVRVYFLRRVDAGEGWFDVDRLGGSVSLKFEPGRWNVRGTARWTTSDYALQRASPADVSVRTRDELELEGRLEYRFSPHWRAYGAWQHEWVRSNVALDAYRSNVGFAGLEYEF